MIKISIIVHLINLAVLHAALCMSILCHSSLLSGHSHVALCMFILCHSSLEREGSS